jgi:hypothetical protein
MALALPRMPPRNGEGCVRNHKAVDFAKGVLAVIPALREVCRDRCQARQEKLEIQIV